MQSHRTMWAEIWRHRGLTFAVLRSVRLTDRFSRYPVGMFDQGFRFAREWMRARRTQMGLTQADIAEELGVGQTAVSQWESGRVAPSMRNWMALAAVLECDPTDLVERDTADSHPVAV